MHGPLPTLALTLPRSQDAATGAVDSAGVKAGRAGESIQHTAAAAKDTAAVAGEAVQKTAADAQDAVVSTAHGAVQNVR